MSAEKSLYKVVASRKGRNSIKASFALLDEQALIQYQQTQSLENCSLVLN